jgi:hypothetical protein
VVLLSGKDDLMDAAEVKDMLDVAGHVKVRAALWPAKLLNTPHSQAAAAVRKQQGTDTAVDCIGSGICTVSSCG